MSRRRVRTQEVDPRDQRRKGKVSMDAFRKAHAGSRKAKAPVDGGVRKRRVDCDGGCSLRKA